MKRARVSYRGFLEVTKAVNCRAMQIFKKDTETHDVLLGARCSSFEKKINVYESICKQILCIRDSVLVVPNWSHVFVHFVYSAKETHCDIRD